MDLPLTGGGTRHCVEMMMERSKKRQDSRAKKQQKEKCRRERMGNALEDLKGLIYDGESGKKVDKVEVLESVVSYVRDKKRKDDEAAYLNGYNSCLVEFTSFLTQAQYLDYQAKANLLNLISNLSEKKMGHQVQLQQQHQQQRHIFEHMQMMQQLNSEKAAILNNQINMVVPSPLSDQQEEPSSTQMPLEELDSAIHNMNNQVKHFIKTEELILPSQPQFVSSTTGSNEPQIPSSCSYAPVLKFKTMEATILPRAPLAQIENQNKQFVTNHINTVFTEMNNNIPSPNTLPNTLNPLFQNFVYQSHQEQLQQAQQHHQQPHQQVRQQQQQQPSISSTTLREVHTSTIHNILGEIPPPLSDSTPHSTTSQREELQFPTGGLPYTGTVYQNQGVMFDDSSLFPMFLQRMYNNREPQQQ